MADMTVLDYAMMVEDSHVETASSSTAAGHRQRHQRRGDEAARRGIDDVLSDGLSMVYSFFDPSEVGRSLGTFMILDHIARARGRALPYVYLGYWDRGSKKMDYKAASCQQRLPPPAGCASTPRATWRRSRRTD